MKLPLTIRQAAESLHVSPDALRQAIHRQTIRADKLGRDWVIDPREVERYRRASRKSQVRHQ